MAESKIKNCTFFSKMYKANYSVPAHGSIALTGNDFNMKHFSGFSPLAIESFYSGNSAALCLQAVNFSTGTEAAVVLFNTSDSPITGTFQTRIAFINNNFYRFIPYA